MESSKGFYDKNLRIFYWSDNEDGVAYGDLNFEHIDYYGLCYIKSDNIDLNLNNNTYLFNEPILVAAEPRKKLVYHSSRKNYASLQIQIHPDMFNGVEEKDKILDFFYKLSDSDKIFKLNEPRNSMLNTCIDLIIEGLFAHCGPFSMTSRMNMLISELNLIYESHFKEYIASTDSVAVQVMDYINRHLLDNITSKQVCQKFYISYNTLNSIYNTYSGLNFEKYVTVRRLEISNRLIDSGRHNLREIAKLSGFRNYQTFFEAYKKHFGIAPSQMLKRKNVYWPLKK